MVILHLSKIDLCGLYLHDAVPAEIPHIFNKEICEHVISSLEKSDASFFVLLVHHYKVIRLDMLGAKVYHDFVIDG